jgi:hypothetical protein
MKTVRFSKVVEKSGKPEVYLLMSETDPDFHKALEAGRVMSLSGEAHGSGTDYGTVGYDKKRRGQLLLFPKSLKAFADAKIIGIKYDLFAEESAAEEKKSPHSAKEKKVKAKPPESPPKAKPAREKPADKKKATPKPTPQKVIPFPAEKKEQDDDDDSDLKAYVRQAMRALEKGNSVAAYNILKRVIPDR